MIARWEQGRATIDALLADRRLERVAPSREVADLLIGQARRHLTTAEAAADLDPTAAFQVAYDAARKALRRSSRTRDCDRAGKERTRSF